MLEESGDITLGFLLLARGRDLVMWRRVDGASIVEMLAEA